MDITELKKFALDAACFLVAFMLTFYAYAALQVATETTFSEIAALALLSAIGATVLFARRKLLDF